MIQVGTLYSTCLSNTPVKLKTVNYELKSNSNKTKIELKYYFCIIQRCTGRYANCKINLSLFKCITTMPNQHDHATVYDY